jgi:hypothetical protein
LSPIDPNVTDDTQQDCFILFSMHAVAEQATGKRRRRRRMVFEAITWDDFVSLGQQRWEQTGQTIGMVDAREDNHHPDDADDSGLGRNNRRRSRRRSVLAGGAADNDGCDTLLLSWLKPMVVIPLVELPRRRFELPAPGGPDSFGIVVSHWNDLPTVQALLFGAKSNKTKASSWGDVSSWSSSSCGTIWGVVLPNDDEDESLDDDDDDEVEEGLNHDDTEEGKSLPQQQQQPEVAKMPLPRLWRPDPMVETVLLPLLKANLADDVWRKKRHSNNHNNSNDRPTTTNSTIMQVLDVGSGVGRDLCFLSEELRGGAVGHEKDDDDDDHDDLRLHFVGADQRYRENNNNDDETTAFWRRRGQLDRCSCLYVDLKKNCLDDFVEQHVLHRGRTATTTTTTTTTICCCCVYAVRYWNDALFARLAKCLTAPGTIVAVSHFCKPHNDYNWDQLHASPKVTLVR